MSIIKPM
jgi:serine/threonine protein kinase